MITLKSNYWDDLSLLRYIFTQKIRYVNMELEILTIKTFHFIKRAHGVSMSTIFFILCFRLFFTSAKLTYTKSKQYKRVFGSIFRLERNNLCSTMTINIKS